MSISTSNMHTDKRHELDAAVRRRFVQIGLLIVIQAVALFGASGHLNWLAAWVYLMIYIGNIGLNAILLLPHGKELIAERGTIRSDVKGWDKAILLLSTFLNPAMLVIAGLDDRFGWSPFGVYAVRIGAVGVMCLGCGLVSWAMATNAYFSSSVRIQRDRGQTVITGGPYHYVRHPGYVGMIVVTLATPFLLGSVISMIPALLLCILIIVRTSLEDKILQQELNGYTAYARRVSHRLLPGIW